MYDVYMFVILCFLRCLPQVWEGTGVVATGRVMLGETDPAKSAPGTIRGDYCIEIGRYAGAHTVPHTHIYNLKGQLFVRLLATHA